MVADNVLQRCRISNIINENLMNIIGTMLFLGCTSYKKYELNLIMTIVYFLKISVIVQIVLLILSNSLIHFINVFQHYFDTIYCITVHIL